MANSGARVLFRVDGGGSVGMGHIVRSAVLARTLRDLHGCKVSFCMREDETGIAHVRRLGWEVQRIDGDDLNCAEEYDAIIVDLPSGVSAEAVRALRRQNEHAVITLMHGMCSGRLEADLVFGTMERLPDESWRGFHGERYQSPAYAILDQPYASELQRSVVVRDVPCILMTMGGSDPYGLTLQALRALDEMQEPFTCTVAVGPAFMHELELQSWLASARRSYEIRRENSLLALMTDSDLAVVSYGTTVYELAATGLPAIALSITDDHAQSAEIFARAGSLISLGLYSEVLPGKLRTSVRELLNDPQRRAAMAKAGQSTVDGKGAERVAGLLVAAMEERRVMLARTGE